MEQQYALWIRPYLRGQFWSWSFTASFMKSIHSILNYPDYRQTPPWTHRGKKIEKKITSSAWLAGITKPPAVWWFHYNALFCYVCNALTTTVMLMRAHQTTTTTYPKEKVPKANGFFCLLYFPIQWQNCFTSCYCLCTKQNASFNRWGKLLHAGLFFAGLLTL